MRTWMFYREAWSESPEPWDEERVLDMRQEARLGAPAVGWTIVIDTPRRIVLQNKRAPVNDLIIMWKR